VMPADGVITYDDRSKNVRSSSSMDSGVGHELGNMSDSQGNDSDQSDLGALPDISHLSNGQTFAARRPLPPHPFEATFQDRQLRPAMPIETNNEVERMLRPADLGADSDLDDYQFESEETFIHEDSPYTQVELIDSLPRPPTPEFLVAGKPLRPLRGKPPKGTSQKKIDLIGAQAKEASLGESLLSGLNDFSEDHQVAVRPPSRGGLAFDVVYGDNQDLEDRASRLKKRQKNNAPKLKRQHSKAGVKKKLIEADLRRQSQQLETITKLQSKHDTVGEIGEKTSRMESIRRAEMKRAQDGAMEKAMLARKQHLEEMRDKIRAKNEKIDRAAAMKLRRGQPSPSMGSNSMSRPTTSGSDQPKLPSLLGF